ncbi:MAG: regulatory protein RecX [Bacteroidota bacterium]
MEQNSKTYTVQEARNKLENYCAYQERCHTEVIQKLRLMNMIPQAIDIIVVHLMDNNYLNEERFASLFTISKLHQKNWGKIRITNELKAKKISLYLITKSLKEIQEEEYYATFEKLSEHHWETMTERNSLKKRKKFCDYLLRKGWESNLVYDKMKELESAGKT